MGLFENFPYTNFHNLNLDWIIKVLKNAVAELEEIQTNWEGVRDTANTAKTTADAAAVKAENARTTANGAMTKAVNAEDKAKNADANAELAVVQSTQAQDAATSAEAAANEAKETAARAENTAGTAKTTADGVDGKATTALSNSAEAVTTANAANEKATTADSKVDALTTTVNNVGKTASDALSLAQTNETDIAANDADITTLESAVFINQSPSIDTAGAGTYTINVSPTVSYNLYNVQVAAPQSLINWLAEVRDLLTLYDVVYSPTLLANTSDGEYTLPVMGTVIDAANIVHMYAILPYSSDDTDGVVSIENINAHLVYKARQKPKP